MDNLYIVTVERDGCSEQDIFSFDRLKYKNKVIFTVKGYPQFCSAYYIQGSEEDACNLKNFCMYKSEFIGKRWLDAFDWI